MRKPYLVVIGDIHFSLKNLELASKSLELAIRKACNLQIPLVINGDLTNDKALLHGTVLNKILSLLELGHQFGVRIIINIGNHDRINEKSKEHTLNCLKVYTTTVIDSADNTWGIIPYCHTSEEFLQEVSKFPKNKILLVHQGIFGAYMGDYVQDRSSISPDLVSGRRIIASHYHKKQDISLPEGGLWSFIGSPYTITLTEANDGPKGFSVLYNDGYLEHIPTNMRKHVKVERDYGTVMEPIEDLQPQDILTIVVTGSKMQLDSLNREDIGIHHQGHTGIKLDYKYIDTQLHYSHINNLNDYDMLDAIIDDSNESQSHKEELKVLWREMINED